MNIISADYVLCCDEDFSVLENYAVAFDEQIKEINTLEILQQKYPIATIIETPKNSVLMPSLVNAHTHLEFSANTTQLSYGNFTNWLFSVMERRGELMDLCSEEIMSQALMQIRQSGTTSLGAISSSGADLEVLASSGMRVVYFVEAIGVREEGMNEAFAGVVRRYEEAQKYQNDFFVPAIAIHSPYAIHPKLLDKLLDFIQNKKALSSVHFLESQDEREWLTRSSGGLSEFFNDFFGVAKSSFIPLQFLEQIASLPHTLLTHGVHLEEAEKQFIQNNKQFFLTHCPTSNALLGERKADINYLQNNRANIGTDGLSSNISLSLFDELRNALFTHSEQNKLELANTLLQFATRNGAHALGINAGEIAVGKKADLLLSVLPSECKKEDLALHTILHTKEVHKSFIRGKLFYG